MITEYIRDEGIAPYVILVSKDGSRFVPVEYDAKVSYESTIFDLIAEADEATATSIIELRFEDPSVRPQETKALALAAISNVAARIA